MASPKPSRLRGALIGFGRVAELAHAPAFRDHPRLRLTAVCDSSPARLERARNLLPEIKTYPDFSALLDSESPDFAVIATPPASHPALVTAALKRGCHVLCEKPLALDPHALSVIRKKAAAQERVVFTVHNWSKAPLYKRLTSMVEAGAIGDLRHIELHTLRPKPAQSALNGWRTDPALAGGGILVDHGWHSLYLIHGLLRQPVLSVKAACRPPAAGRRESEASVFLEFPSATAFLRLSWHARFRRNWGYLCGTRGTLDIQDDHLILRNAAEPRRFDFAEKLSAGSAHPEWLRELLADFLAEMTDPGRRGRNLEEASFCSEILDRIYRPAARPLEKVGS